MSELGLPKDLREAVPFVVWGVLVLGFGLEFCTALAHEEWIRATVCFLLMCGLAAMALYSKDVKAWLAAVHPNYIVPVLMLLLLIVALSPYIQERQWPAVPFYRVTGSSATLTVTRGNPAIGKAVAGAIAPLESQLKTKDQEIAALKQQLNTATANSHSSSSADLSRFLKDFQRVSAEEHYMAVTMREDIPYFKFDTQGLPRPRETAPITANERKDWRDFLKNLRSDCVTLNLVQTRDAIDNALGYFADDYTDANRFTSWQAYHEVSEALISEVARKGIGLSSGQTK